MSQKQSSRLPLSRLKEKYGTKPFPIHASFFLGEIALFSLFGLVITGIFLSFFYEPSTRSITVEQTQLPAAYASVLRIDQIPFGLIVRRIHHWSAHILLATLVTHMSRVYFTGAYRKPRDVNWVVGFILLLVSIFAAFVGYLLPFDEFAVTATGIGYNILGSIPWVGTSIANLLFAGPFPNELTVPRFYSLHIMLIPLIFAILIAVHLAILFAMKHTQHHGVTASLRSALKEEREGIIGIPFWPEQGLNMFVLFLAYAVGVTVLAGFVPVHPIETFGPAQAGTPVMKPDWYLLWVYGLLKLIPSVSITVLGAQITSEFIGGVLLPGALLSVIFLAPFIGARLSNGDDEMPQYATTEPVSRRPKRTGLGVGAITFFVLASVAGYMPELGLTPGVMTGVLLLGTVLASGSTYYALTVWTD